MIIHFDGKVDYDLEQAEKDVLLLGGVLSVKHHLLSKQSLIEDDREQATATNIGDLVGTIYQPRVTAQLEVFASESDMLFDEDIDFYREELETVLGSAEGLAKYLAHLTFFHTTDLVEVSNLRDSTVVFETIVQRKASGGKDG